VRTFKKPGFNSARLLQHAVFGLEVKKEERAALGACRHFISSGKGHALYSCLYAAGRRAVKSEIGNVSFTLPPYRPQKAKKARSPPVSLSGI